MKEEKILSVIRDVIVDVLDDEDIKITPETTARDVDGWDSLAQISIIVELEKEFKTKFQLDEIKILSNVGDMVTLVIQKLNSAPDS